MGVYRLSSAGTLSEARTNYKSMLAGREGTFPSFPFEFLVIAGGGGSGDSAGSGYGGGGGAGGYRLSFNDELSGANSPSEPVAQVFYSANVTITVGAGGPRQGNGAPSVFGTISSVGGGRGGDYGAGNAQNGGAGGGAGGNNTVFGLGTANQGFNGNFRASGFGGNGGGAGGVLTGLASTITGTSVVRATGGNGGATFVDGSGTPNTGNGGTPRNNQIGNAGFPGGSGLVALRFPSELTMSGGAGLVFTSSTVGSQKLVIFTAGTGSVSFS